MTPLTQHSPRYQGSKQFICRALKNQMLNLFLNTLPALYTLNIRLTSIFYAWRGNEYAATRGIYVPAVRAGNPHKVS